MFSCCDTAHCLYRIFLINNHKFVKVPRGKWSCPGCSNKSPRKNNKAARGARIQQQRPRTATPEPEPEPEPEQEEEKKEQEEQPVAEAEKDEETAEPPAAVEKEEPVPEPVPEPVVPEKKPVTRKKSSRATKVFSLYVYCLRHFKRRISNSYIIGKGRKGRDVIPLSNCILKAFGTNIESLFIHFRIRLSIFLMSFVKVKF